MRARRPAARCGGRERGPSQRLPFRRHERARRPTPTIRRFQPPGSVRLRPAPFHHGVDSRQAIAAPADALPNLAPMPAAGGKRTGQAGDDGRARYRARCASRTSAVDRTCGVRANRNETLAETTCAPPAHHGHSPSEFKQTGKRLSRDRSSWAARRTFNRNNRKKQRRRAGTQEHVRGCCTGARQEVISG